jgi:NitT/TauT family transport system ATP-binding protein
VSSARVVVGFIPLLDCAALVVALERGFAAEEGLDLMLIRESSWANIRDRLLVGHFDAAHLLGPMTVASTLGIGHVALPLLAPCALGSGGNAITVSNSLWSRMAAAGAAIGAPAALQVEALRRVVTAHNLARSTPLTFGMVYPFSCHNYELRYWLASGGIDPDHDVRLVVIPPPYLVDALRAGQIDGFCVGEPWNSVAVDANTGVIVAPTTSIWRASPEKVLGCRAQWAEKHPERVAALVRAVFRAALWCEEPRNHSVLARLLAQPRYVDAPAALLYGGIANRLRLVPDGPPVHLPDFFVSARDAATFPWISHALWYYTQMLRWRQIESAPGHIAQVCTTQRPDLYRDALKAENLDLPTSDCRQERFFDGQIFDARSWQDEHARSAIH